MNLVGSRFGGQTATLWGGSTPGSAVASTPPATSVAPATAVYGPGAMQAVGTPGVWGSNPGQLAVYFGFACLIGLVIIRQSLPEK